MKKLSAISFAAFYLLLTTGMYVCLLHCASDYLFSSHEKNLHASKSHEDENKSCSDDENCRCCNSHDQFIIKENIQFKTDNSLCAILLPLYPVAITNLSVAYRQVSSATWPKDNSPPKNLKTPAYISYRSLLI